MANTKLVHSPAANRLSLFFGAGTAFFADDTNCASAALACGEEAVTRGNGTKVVMLLLPVVAPLPRMEPPCSALLRLHLLTRSIVSMSQAPSSASCFFSCCCLVRLAATPQHGDHWTQCTIVTLNICEMNQMGISSKPVGARQLQLQLTSTSSCHHGVISAFTFTCCCCTHNNGNHSTTSYSKA